MSRVQAAGLTIIVQHTLFQVGSSMTKSVQAEEKTLIRGADVDLHDELSI
jgi:hypothetical protein